MVILLATMKKMGKQKKNDTKEENKIPNQHFKKYYFLIFKLENNFT
jgi:hypothetical protein